VPLIRSLVLCLLAAAGSACAVRHQARGLVLQVDPTAATVTVSHDAIPGYMDAMAMPFTAGDPASLDEVRPGDRIAFRLTVRNGRTTIDRVRILSAAPEDAGMRASPAAPSLVAIGQPVPDFTLTDHRGRRVSLSSLRGTVVALTFVYTRCPLPDYCPRMVANLRTVGDRFAARLGRDVTLLTVTFDPQYDTPETLASYARRYRADVPGWHFLTGPAEEIGRVCALFGVEFWPEEGLITHTLQTAVIDRAGTLVAAVEGKDYSGRQLGDLIELALRGR
jgi:protein SCO1/2